MSCAGEGGGGGWGGFFFFRAENKALHFMQTIHMKMSCSPQKIVMKNRMSSAVCVFFFLFFFS